jgi:uncharacterized damage-inducible protein DinB
VRVSAAYRARATRGGSPAHTGRLRRHDVGMAWTAPNPPELADGPLVGEDRPILEAYLAWQRHTLLALCAGLTGEQLTKRAIPPSTLSLLGLVRHLGKVERIWLRQRAAGEAVGPMYGTPDDVTLKDADFNDLEPAQAEADFDRYREECRLADAAVANWGFDDTFTAKGETYSLRVAYVHLIAEYARHNGHADLLREQIDGTTGL